MAECLIRSNDPLYRECEYYINNKSQIDKFYKVVTHEKFIKKNKKRLEFAGEGIPTFASAMKVLAEDNAIFGDLNFLTDQTIKDAIKKTLNPSKMEYSMDTAIAACLEFNNSHAFSPILMAIPKQYVDGIGITVVDRTPLEENNFTELIQKQVSKNRIVIALRKAGVPVDYTDKTSTINYEIVKNGLGAIQKIVIYDGALDKATANAAAEYIIQALKDNSLVKRAIKYADSKGLDAKELIANALIQDTKERPPIIKRLIQSIKNIFKNFTASPYQILKEKYARKIAKKFLDFSLIDYDNSELFKEEGSVKEDPINKDIEKKIEQLLINAGDFLGSLDSYWNKKFKDMLKDMQLVRGSIQAIDANIETNALYLPIIANALKQLGEEIVGVIEKLNDVDTDNISEINKNGIQYAKNLRGVHEFCKTTLAVTKLIQESLPEMGIPKSGAVDISSLGLVTESVDMSKTIQDIEKTAISMTKIMHKKQKELVLEFLKSVYGKSGIDQATGVMFNVKYQRSDGSTATKWIGHSSKTISETTLEEALTSLEHDNTWWEYWVTSMVNNPDIVSALIDKAIKQANTQADLITIELQDQLRLFREKCRDAGYRRGDFFELDEEGKPTGNILTEYNWHEYEQDFNNFNIELQNQFLKEYPDAMEFPDFIRSVKFKEFADPLIKEWHKKHSRWDTDRDMYVPATIEKPAYYTKTNEETGEEEVILVRPAKDYSNHQYTELKDAAEKYIEDREKGIVKEEPRESKIYRLLIEYQRIKEQIDEALPEGATKYYMLPQFKGTFSARVRNAGLLEGPGKALRNKLIEQFTVDANDTDFGSHEYYNTEKQAGIFADKGEFERQKIDRLPLFGLNRLKDPTQMTDDIFFSTLAYGAMAYSHDALYQVSDLIEVTHNQLAQRKDKTGKREIEREKKSRCYRRFSEYLQQHLYGIGIKPHVTKGIAWNKIAMLFTKLGTAVWLGGNAQSAITNVGTGGIEIFKEATVGQYYNLADWTAAHKYYYSSLGSNLAQMGKQDKDDKISLFIQMFDARGNNDVEFRNWRDHSHIAEFAYNRSLYALQAMGEHYMQTIPFLAMAHNQKLYRRIGDKIEEINLFDAYEVQTIPRGKRGISKRLREGSGPKRLVLKEGIFKTMEGAEDYQDLEDLKELIQKGIDDGTLSIPDKYDDLIDNYGLPKTYEDQIDIRNAIAMIEDIQLHKMQWTGVDIADFKMRAREVCNRMHGVYNKEDKTLIQREILGNMFMSMKGYALGLVQRRFHRRHWNPALHSWSEGSYVTFAKQFAVLASNLIPFMDDSRRFTNKDMSRKKIIWNSLLGFMIPYYKKPLENLGFAKDQIYNARRNFQDAMSILGLLLVMSLTEAGGDDDDDDDKFTGLIYYFAQRLYYEQAAFAGIGTLYEAKQFFKGYEAVPGIAVFSDIVKLLEYGWAQYVEGVDIEDSSAYYQKDMPQYNIEKYQSKFWRKFQKMCPYWKSYFVYADPYSSAASFAYYRGYSAETSKEVKEDSKEKEKTTIPSREDVLKSLQ